MVLLNHGRKCEMSLQQVLLVVCWLVVSCNHQWHRLTIVLMPWFFVLNPWVGVFSCYFCGYFDLHHYDLTPKGTSTSEWANETWEFVGVGEVWNNMLRFFWSWFFRVPVGPMVNFLQDPLVIYEGWTSLGGNNCCKMEKEVTMSQKTRHLGGFVDLFLADSYPLFFQGFQSLNRQMLWDDGSRIFFSALFYTCPHETPGQIAAILLWLLILAVHFGSPGKRDLEFPYLFGLKNVPFVKRVPIAYGKSLPGSWWIVLVVGYLVTCATLDDFIAWWPWAAATWKKKDFYLGTS